MLTLQVLRLQWSWINHPELPMSLFSKTISLNMYWHMWALIKLWKPSLNILYGGYISIFGALVRLLSDRGTSFTSSIIEGLCKILGIKWLQTMPYHPQTNGLVERWHQTYYAHDEEAGRRQESQLAITFGWNSVCLQCHLICSDTGYSPHLFNVWTMA